MDKEEFKLFLEEKRSWYKKIEKVFCPILNKWVIFNAKGFRHLRYDGSGVLRSQEQQIYRMHLFEFLIGVIEALDSVVQYKKQYSKYEGRDVEYWSIKQVVGDRKEVVVILRRIGTGNITFYSIWRNRIKKSPLK